MVRIEVVIKIILRFGIPALIKSATEVLVPYK